MFPFGWQVRAEELQSSIAKLHTPRELMICMMEVINRLEGRAIDRRPGKSFSSLLANPEDLEIAVNRAREQAS
jgi:hypothetical protein